MSVRTIRGNVIQVPVGAEPGLLVIDGQQHEFRLAGLWQSASAPAPNQTVEVSTDEAGTLTAVVPIDAQALAQEKLEQAGREAVATAGTVFTHVRDRMGLVLIIVCAVLFLAWFLLPALGVDVGFGESRTFTVSDILGLRLQQSGAEDGFGFWSLLGLLAVLAPWAAPWLRARWAPLLNCAPLLLVIIAFLRVRWQMHAMVSRAIDAAGQLGGAQAQSMVSTMADQMGAQLSKAVSFGIGLWIVLLLSLYLAYIGIRRYRTPALASPTLS